MDTPTAVVTGAFSYTGSAVAKSLLARGFAVRTLTNRRVKINDPGARLEAYPLRFEDPARLVEAMRGAQVFVNTYWVHYPYVGAGFDRAAKDTYSPRPTTPWSGPGTLTATSAGEPLRTSLRARFKAGPT